MNLSPKIAFLKTEEAKLLADLVATKWFHEVLVVTITQMILDLGGADTPSKGWDNYSQLVGAKKFVHQLLNLPDPDIKERPKSSAELEYLR